MANTSLIPRGFSKVDERSDAPRIQRIVAKTARFRNTGIANTTPVDLTDNPLSQGTIQALQLTSDLVNQFNRLSSGERANEGLIQVIGQQKEQALRLLTNQYQLNELSDEGLSRAESMLAVLPNKPPDVRSQGAGDRLVTIEATGNGGAEATVISEAEFKPDKPPREEVLIGIRDRAEAEAEVLEAQGDEKGAALARRKADELTGVIEAGADSATFSPRAQTARAEGRSGQQIGDMQDRFRQSLRDFASTTDAAEAFAQTTLAAGFAGFTIEKGAGLARQFGTIGNFLVDMFITPETEAAVVDARTKGRVVVSKLLREITQETQGRFTEPERDRADEIIKALKVGASARQVGLAFKALGDIQRDSITRDGIEFASSIGLGEQDFGTLEGQGVFVEAVMERFSMPKQQAFDLLDNIDDFFANPVSLASPVNG